MKHFVSMHNFEAESGADALKQAMEAGSKIKYTPEQIYRLRRFGNDLVDMLHDLGLALKSSDLAEDAKRFYPENVKSIFLVRELMDGKRTKHTEKLMELLQASKTLAGVIQTLEGLAGFLNHIGAAFWGDVVNEARTGDMSKWKPKNVYAAGSEGMAAILRGLLVDRLKEFEMVDVSQLELASRDALSKDKK